MTTVTRLEGVGLHPKLGPRQAEVLLTYAKTGSQAITAHELGISRQTVKNHLTDVYRTLEVETGVQAMYKVFGGELILQEKRELMRELLTKYLHSDWLDDALRLAAQAAVDAMIRAIDQRLYVEKAEELAEAAKAEIEGQRKARQWGAAPRGALGSEGARA